MKNYTVIMIWFFSIAACQKSQTNPPQTTPPKMIYTDLQDAVVKFNQHITIDLDSNGTQDVLFSSLMVGDPLHDVDKWEWWVSSSIDTRVAVDTNENIPVLHLTDSIPVNNFSGYQWFEATSIILAQKVIPVSVPPFWEGAWKEALHRFISLQLKRDGGIYNAWVEVSFSTADEHIILHRAGASREKNKIILAGK